MVGHVSRCPFYTPQLDIGGHDHSLLLSFLGSYSSAGSIQPRRCVQEKGGDRLLIASPVEVVIVHRCLAISCTLYM